MKVQLTSFLLCGCALVSACATPGGGPAGLVILDPHYHVAGVNSLDGTPDGRCFASAAFMSQLSGVFRGAATPKWPVPCSDLGDALSNSLGTSASADEATRKRVRNLGTQALLAASDEQCGGYLRFLEQYHGNVNNIFGISSMGAATVAAVASGGIVPVAAGVASLLAGSGATLRNSNFHDQTLATISSAFTQRRARARTEIEANLKNDSYDDFNSAKALERVIVYHHDCSIQGGLNEIQKTLNEASSPSLDTIKTYIAQTQEARAALKAMLDGTPAPTPAPVAAAPAAAAAGK